MHDDVTDDPWTKAAGVWTIMAVFTFVGLCVASVWIDGPIAKLWFTWLILGILGTCVMWLIAFAKEGAG